MSRYYQLNPDSPIIHDHFTGGTISKGLPGQHKTMNTAPEPIIDNKTPQIEAQRETEAIPETVQDPSQVFATDRTDLDAVIESLDGKGLAKSHDIPRFIVWFPALKRFSGVNIEHYVTHGWDNKIHALIFPDGRVVRAEDK